MTHENVVGTSKSLAGDGYVLMKSTKIDYWELTAEGKKIQRDGSQEAKCFTAIKAAGGLDKKGLEEAVGKDAAKVGMGNCMKNKWISKDGDLMKAAVEEIEDLTKVQLTKLAEFANPEENGSALLGKEATMLKKRKLIAGKSRTSYDVTRGPEYAEERVKKAADLTKEMIDSGAWESTKFKAYNFKTVGEKVGGGYLHPLLKVRAEFRKILCQMGFEEMPTNKWVESR